MFPSNIFILYLITIVFCSPFFGIVRRIGLKIRHIQQYMDSSFNFKIAQYPNVQNTLRE